jgi:hypothetical protein
MALHRLPSIAAEYLEGGAEDELSLAANRAGFDMVRFRPVWWMMELLRVPCRPSPMLLRPRG